MADPLFEQFAKLPQHLKSPVTSPEAMQTLDALEEKYAVPLADLVLRLMVRQVQLADLHAYFQETLKMPGGKATALYQDIQNRLLHPVLPYLQGQIPTRQAQEPAPQRGPVLQPPVRQAPKPAPNAPRPTPVPEQRTTAPQRIISPAQQPQGRIVAARTQQQTAPVPVSNTRPLPPSSNRVPTQPNPSALVPPLPARRPPTPPPQQKQVAAPAPSPIPTAAHFLYAEDEEEVRKHQQRLEHVAGASPTASVDDHIERLLTTPGLPQRDAVLDNRLRSLLRSRMRDVRTSDDLQRMLMRPEKIGGLGYDAATTAKVVKAAENAVAAIHATARAAPSSPAAQPPVPAQPPAPRPSAALPSRPQPPTIHPPVPDRPLATERPQPLPVRPLVLERPPTPDRHPTPIVRQPSAAAAPVTVPVQQTVRVQPMQPAQPIPEPKSQPTAEAGPAVVRRQRDDDAYGRRVLRDVKHPKPMSLVDELADVAVEDFREGFGGPRAAVAKVVEKLALLAEESYAQRAEGVAAWRRSALYRMYLDLGRESMASGKAVDDIIADRTARHEPTLTAEEFALIADLNRQIAP